MTNVADALTKVLFITEDDEHETLWAEEVGHNLFRLDNSPLFAYDVSWEDVVEAFPDNSYPMPVFRRVVRKSGNRTLRIILKPSAKESQESQHILDELINMGCS